MQGKGLQQQKWLLSGKTRAQQPEGTSHRLRSNCKVGREILKILRRKGLSEEAPRKIAQRASQYPKGLILTYDIY